MVTLNTQIGHWFGLSTDTKPTSGIRNGDDFTEIDTGKKWYYDEENGEWLDPTATDDADNAEG